MTSDIENLLADLRDPQPSDRPTPDRKRMAIVAATVGVLTLVLTGGVLAFGSVATQAGPPPVDPSLAADLLESSATPSPEIPATTPAVLPAAPVDDAGSPRFDKNTDIDTIPIPSDFPSEEVANAKLWLAQQSITAQCMDEKGFHYTFTTWWLRDPSAPLGPAAGEGPGTAFWVALWGEDDQPFGDDYDWTQAGCAGYAVHATGMD